MKSFIRKLMPGFVYRFYAALRRWLMFLFLLGRRYQCPFCGWHFRKFLQAGLDTDAARKYRVIGLGLRQNASCPRCSSTDKERLVYLYLLKKTDVFGQSLKLLHVAAEKNLGRTLRRQKNIEYMSADIDPSRAMVKMDITDIQYPDNSFDVILCSHVLEHVLDDRRAMQELYRVLKPGGEAILQVPISPVLEKTFEDASVTDPQEREKIFGQSDHVRIYGNDYKNRLSEAGFRVVVWNAEKEFGGNFVKQYALNRDESVFTALRQ